MNSSPLQVPGLHPFTHPLESSVFDCLLEIAIPATANVITLYWASEDHGE